MSRLPQGRKIALYLVLGVGAVTMVIPFLWMLSTSVKQPHEVFAPGGGIRWLPSKLFWRNYPDAWNEINLLRLYLSSIFVAIVGTFGQVLTSSMAAYAFARLRFPGRDKLFLGYLATIAGAGLIMWAGAGKACRSQGRALATLTY